MEDGTRQIYMTLRIIGNDYLNFDDIAKNLPIIPSKKAQKGDAIKLPGGKILSSRTVEQDLLLYEINSFDDEVDFDKVKQKLCEFLPYKQYLSQLKKTGYVCFRLSLTSNYAQLYFEMPSDILGLLEELSASLEISILSFGEVIKENASFLDKIGSRWRNICKNYFLSQFGFKKLE